MNYFQEVLKFCIYFGYKIYFIEGYREIGLQFFGEIGIMREFFEKRKVQKIMVEK